MNWLRRQMLWPTFYVLHLTKTLKKMWAIASSCGNGSCFSRQRNIGDKKSNGDLVSRLKRSPGGRVDLMNDMNQ
jgi:hypothetical protein